MALTTDPIAFVLAFKWLLVGGLLATYAARSYGQYRRLSAFKGPWLAAWSDMWFAKCAFGIGPENHALLTDVCNKYGTLARLGPNTLVTTSPEVIMRMSAVRSPYTRSKWYHGLKIPPGEHNIFSQTDEEKHTRRRAQMAEGYSGKTNPSLEPAIDNHVQNLITLIRSKYLSTCSSLKPLDMARKAAFFTLDVITDISFGQPFGNVTSDTDMYDYIELTEEMLKAMAKVTSIPILRMILDVEWVNKLLFPSDKSEKGIGKMMGVAKKLVHDRFMKPEASPQDMLSVFISRGLTERDLVAESLLSILAGADTTATVIRITTLYVSTCPHVLSSLQAEIDAFVSSQPTLKSNSDDSHVQNVIRDCEARELPYLQAVIKESMRIWAPVTGLLSKVTPPEGDFIDVDINGTGSTEKVFIPGGTLIAWASFGVQRNKAVFGEDAEVFRPERWLIEDTKRLAYMQKVVDLNFGYGKYQCLGKPIAWMELNKCVFELFRNFNFQIMNPAAPWKSENYSLWLQSQLWVRVTERDGVVLEA